MLNNAQVEPLSPSQRELLDDVAAYDFIRAKNITADAILALTDRQCDSLRSATIRQGVTDGWMQLAQVLALSNKQYQLLNDVAAYDFIRAQNIPVDAVLALTDWRCHNLLLANIRQRVTDGWMSFAQAGALNHMQYELLDNDAIYTFIRAQNITADAILALTEPQCFNLQSVYIRQSVTEGWMRPAQALALSGSQGGLLDDAAAHAFIRVQNITAADVLALTDQQCYDCMYLQLVNVNIRQGVNVGWMQPAQARALSNRQYRLLNDAGAYDFIRAQNITADAILTLTDQQCRNLLTTHIRQCVTEGWMQSTEAIALSDRQYQLLNDATAYDFIRAQNITAGAVLALTDQQCSKLLSNLLSREIRVYAISHLLSPEQISALKPNWLRSRSYYVATAMLIIALALLATSVVGTIGFIPFLVAAGVSIATAIIATCCKPFVIDPTHEIQSQVIGISAAQKLQLPAGSLDDLIGLHEHTSSDSVVNNTPRVFEIAGQDLSINVVHESSSSYIYKPLLTNSEM